MRPSSRFPVAAAILAAATCIGPAAATPPAPLQTELALRVHPYAHRLEAEAVLTAARAPGGGRWVLDLHHALEIMEAELDGRAASFEPEPSGEEGAAVRRWTVRIPDGAEGKRLLVRYAGEIHDPPRVARFSRQEIADQTTGTIQEEGVFLAPASAWYPRPWPRALSTFRTDVTLPEGWDAVSEGSRLAREAGEGAVRVVHEAAFPLDGVYLTAARWVRFEERHGDRTVAVYVLPGEEALGPSYMSASRRYLELYSDWLGPYAYDRFSVVMNFFPTGYGMPGYTVLGREVMRLPFILTTSLGHEVAHNWWGNGVYVDESGGNWCEGLTTFVADYHYRRLQGPDAAAEYRREMVRDYTNYVSEPDHDFPLSEFTERSTPATRAVGYGKTLMVFHMLETRLGRERFDGVLREVYRDHLHRPVSWSTWREAFSRAAGEDLGGFFEQWVERSGAPELTLENVAFEPGPGGGGVVSGTVRRSGGEFRLDVPIQVEGEGGLFLTAAVEVGEEATPFHIEVDFRPEGVRLDPGQDVFRRLHPLEIPPVLSRVLGDPAALFVVSGGGDPGRGAAYREMAAVLTRTGEGEVVDAAEVSPERLAGRSVFLLGYPEAGPLRALLDGLPAEIAAEPARFAVEGTDYAEPGAALLAVGRHPGESSRGVVLFHGLSAEAVRAAGRKIPHYGKYSWLAFVDGDNLARGVARADGGPVSVRLNSF